MRLPNPGPRAATRYAPLTMRLLRSAPLGLFLLSGCSVWLFSGESWIDRTRPAVLVETTGGVELGAATEFGVLTLGRTAQSGPCLVHYFLGPTPLVESGTLAVQNPTFTVADIDLKTQAVRTLDRSPVDTDELWAMWTPDGTTTTTLPVTLASAPGVEGDLLVPPAGGLPPGACILCRGKDDTVLFVGLVAGKATLQTAGTSTDYFVFAGVDRLRELLALPHQHPAEVAPRFRPDDITVLKQKPPAPKPAEAKNPPAPPTPKAPGSQ